MSDNGGGVTLAAWPGHHGVGNLGEDGPMPPWRTPVWPTELELQSDVGPSDWILPQLLPTVISGGDGTPVGGIVPMGFPAYVRVLHPAGTGGREPPVRWREMAAANGRTYHPLMQWEQIREPDPEALGLGRISDPSTGTLEPEQCQVLYAALEGWTSTPGACWIGIWSGFGSLYAPSGRSASIARFQRPGHDEERADAELDALVASWEEAAEAVKRAPGFHHPGREYLLAKGPCSAICLLGEPPLHVTPSLVWPEDHAWVVGSEIDFDSTLVAGSRQCVDALLREERLETVEVGSDDRLDYGGDVINPPVERR